LKSEREYDGVEGWSADACQPFAEYRFKRLGVNEAIAVIRHNPASGSMLIN
jgi:hypothetical protein